jgi:response regulator RpfG family c-di-GMP phosphodiesterase
MITKEWNKGMSSTSEKSPPQTKRESVLFVDDERHILSSLKRLVKPLKLECHIAESGPEALEIMAEHNIDLIVSDMRMPEMDGATFLTEAKKIQPDTARILLTGYADIESTIKALNKGEISRYISKPWDDEEFLRTISESLKLKSLEREKEELSLLTKQQNDELLELNKTLESKVEQRTRQIREAAEQLDQVHQELQSSYDSFVEVFSSFVNAREPLQAAESGAVAELSQQMASALKLKPDLVKATYYAGLLHQVGKVGLSDEILAKPEEMLSTEERKAFQQYPTVGETALTAIHGFEKTSQLIRSHTEYYDGSGYPDSLKGNSVRSGARILRVVKDYIGFQSGILREQKLSADEAFEAIQESAGIKYDPIVVKCLDHFRKDYCISALYSNEISVTSLQLLPGMKLTRNLTNSEGLLLVSKGYVVTDPIINKIIGMEEAEDAEFSIFVSTDYDHDKAE